VGFSVQHIQVILARAEAFREEAHAVLGVHETSKSRVVLLEDTYDKLTGLSLKQDELFRQALRCVEHGLFRAAHVMAWSGCIDFLEERLATDGFKKLRAARPKWNLKSTEDLREQYTEYAIIEASTVSGLCNKNEKKALHGLLSKRNECAHPSSYSPELNDTLGYITELIQRIQNLQAKKY
jgi:hypothetical protein